MCFLDTKSETDQGTTKLSNVQGYIHFNHISVQYGNETTKALDDFNLNIRPGEKIAFVGRSGSGKTTAINLLPRFINPVAGEILLDNINIQEVNLANLRSQFALVSQEIFCLMIPYLKMCVIHAQLRPKWR